MSVKVAIIGMGSMGKGLFYQIHRTPGIECLAIADKKIERCTHCAAWLNANGVYTGSSKLHLNSVVRRGQLAIADSDIIPECGLIDVVIEASNSIDEGVKYAEKSLNNGKHLVLMNSEVDLTFGPYLLKLAKKNGVTYTSCDGDQHGVIKRLVDDVESWGFKLVMAGNIKGFLDLDSNPTKIIPEADKRNLDYRMATAYTDGTKLAIEMALVANALGLRPNQDHMTGPKVGHVSGVLRVFDFHKILAEGPVVDYILGAEPGGGIFVVGFCDDPYQKEMMKYYKMGDGPFYVFYRPYHLCHVESMRCIFDAVEGKPLLQPNCGMMTNVYARAKKDLSKKSVLDGVGGYTCYGTIRSLHDHFLPICLSEGVRLRRAVAKDDWITLDDVYPIVNSDSWNRYQASM
jgi:predicted homoserine dehydrogenase-like protein